MQSPLRKLISGIFSIASLCVIFFLYYSCSSLVTEGATKEHTAQEKADEEKAAKDMGVTVDFYRTGQDRLEEAHLNCMVAAIKLAKWGYEMNGSDELRWKTDGSVLTVKDDDLRFKNGFGASAAVTYTCLYSLRTKVAVIVLVEDE